MHIYIYIYLYTYRRGSCGLSLSIYMYVSIYIYIYRFTQVICLQTYLCIILYMYQISMILVQATKNKTSCQIYLPVPVEQTKHSQIPITFEPENCRALGRLQRNSRHTSFAPTDRPGNQAAQSDNLTENSRTFGHTSSIRRLVFGRFNFRRSHRQNDAIVPARLVCMGLDFLSSAEVQLCAGEIHAQDRRKEEGTSDDS